MIAIYRAAQHGNTQGQTTLGYTPLALLVNTLVKDGQTNAARKVLIEAYRSIDGSRKDANNPGYAEYQSLEAFKSLGKELQKREFPIDAVMIYRRVCSEPELFSAAGRWGGRTNLSDFRKLRYESEEKVNEAAAERHLDALADEFRDINTDTKITLIDGKIDLIDPDGGSSFAMAVRLASDTESGLAKVNGLLETLLDRMDSAKHWSIPAAAMMLAMGSESEKAIELSDTLFERLPTTESIQESSDATSANKYRPLSQLYAVAKFALESKAKSLAPITSRIADYLDQVAKATSDVETTLAGASLTDADSTLTNVLNAVESSKKPGMTLPETQVNLCLDIAKSTAAQGKYSISARALSVALQDGPPLRQLNDTGNSDPFALATQRSSYSSSSNRNEENALASLTASVIGVTDLYLDAIGGENDQWGCNQ